MIFIINIIINKKMEYNTPELILIVAGLILVVQVSHLFAYCRRVDRLPLVEALLSSHKDQAFA
jgi:hypothetical protein